MTRQEIIDRCAAAAREAQIRDDVCSRSVLIGLSEYFDIPEEMIRAAASLCGGAGASSGTCGTFTCGLLAVGWKYNVPLAEELEDPDKFGIGQSKFMAFRDRYLEAFGTTLCPEIHKQVYGRSYIFTNPADCEEYFKITDHNVQCAAVVEKATRLVAEFLLEDVEESAL